jgi:hypothetical protein
MRHRRSTSSLRLGSAPEEWPVEGTATGLLSVLGYSAARAPHDSARIVRRSTPHGLEIG